MLSACGGNAASDRGNVTEVPTAAAGQDPLMPQALKERATVRVGLSSKLEVYAPILIGQEFGEFDKENIELQVEYMPPTDSPLLLTQGELDIVYSGFTAGVLNLIAGNESVRFAYPGGTVSSETQGIYLAKTLPEIADLTAADFKGKKIMTSSGSASSTAYFLWKKATELTGGDALKPTDITWEASQLPEIPLILKRGAADGGQVISPYHNQLIDDACCKVFPGAYPKAPQTGYLVGPSLAGKKDVALAFFRAMARTERTYLQGDYHKDDKVLAAMAKTMEQKAEVLAKGDATVFAPTFDTNAGAFPELQKFFRAFGDISYAEDLPVERIYDVKYVEALAGKQ
jgi:NitT/TauT family transport system substrate-binding protein